jgi:hypothetical protein
VKFTLESVLAMLPTSDGKWPRLSDPVFALDNTRLAQAHSARCKDGERPDLTEIPEYAELMQRARAARGIA